MAKPKKIKSNANKPEVKTARQPQQQQGRTKISGKSASSKSADDSSVAVAAEVARVAAALKEHDARRARIAAELARLQLKQADSKSSLSSDRMHLAREAKAKAANEPPPERSCCCWRWCVRCCCSAIALVVLLVALLGSVPFWDEDYVISQKVLDHVSSAGDEIGLRGLNESFAVKTMPRPGQVLAAAGFRKRRPVVFVPGIISSGLEVWQAAECAASMFRSRLWGSSSMMQKLAFDPQCWINHIKLNRTKGTWLDPDGIKLRAASGLGAADYFITGACVRAGFCRGGSPCRAGHCWKCATFVCALVMRGWGVCCLLAAITLGTHERSACMPPMQAPPAYAFIKRVLEYSCAHITCARNVRTGYNLWGKLIHNLADVGYDESSMYLAAYDWRLPLGELELRDRCVRARQCELVR
jgi:hypothetical protein